MLSRSDLKSFQGQQEYPAVSILAPTHRTAPANKQDPIKVKNLVRKAIDRLHGEFPKRKVASIVGSLQKLVSQIDWQHTLDGIALFVSRSQSIAVSLPFRVKGRAVVDETFATRDLVYAFNRATHYRVLVLSNTARLFDAWTAVLEEHRTKPFPLENKGRGAATRLPGGKGINRSAVRDDDARKFFQAVDRAVAAAQKEKPLPLVVVGVERNLAFFHEVTSQPESIVGMLAGNHDQTSPSALGKLVWPVFDLGATRLRTEALMQLDKAVSANLHASGIDQVWRAAVEGRCRTLLVERDFKYPADLNSAGDRLLKYTGRGPAALDDAVDEVIERVMNSGGKVYFYAPGDLAVHQRIAAVLRH